MKNSFNVLIRSKCSIKSRHWWRQNIEKSLLVINSLIPKKLLSKYSNFSFNLLITNDIEIRNFNKVFRKKDKPTDVLSFNYSGSYDPLDPSLGDIIISVDTAIKQSNQKFIPIESELILLFIHGYLHLLGYDHIKKTDAKTMFKYQNEIMKELIY